jgi:hypothetical protein
MNQLISRSDKLFHPDLHPGNKEKVKSFQQRLNETSILTGQTSDQELIDLLKKGSPEKTFLTHLRSNSWNK